MRITKTDDSDRGGGGSSFREGRHRSKGREEEKGLESKVQGLDQEPHALIEPYAP